MPPLPNCFSWLDEAVPTPDDGVKSSPTSSEKPKGDEGASTLTIYVHDLTGRVDVKNGRAIGKLRLRDESTATDVANTSRQHGTWAFSIDASDVKDSAMMHIDDQGTFKLDLRRDATTLCQRLFGCCSSSGQDARWKPLKRVMVHSTQSPEKSVSEKKYWASQVSRAVLNARKADY